MLTRPLTEEKRKEFLQATGTQLDKLDFLIQGMVKTSRLETGVITLEKQDAVIGDTLVSAINGVLAPMEQKEIRGIPEHSQGTIFKRFYRDEAVHDIDGGGIGLYLAREIITMQGGYITVESKVGEGSTFSVFLPIK